MSIDLDFIQKIVYYSLWDDDIESHKSKSPLNYTESQ